MRHVGDLGVLRQLKNSAMRPRLVIFPGTMRGVYGGGQVTALEKHNPKLIHGFEGIDCASTGSPAGAYALAGQAEEGTQHYYQDCTWPEFISFKRALSGGHAVDVGFLAGQFREGPKRLKQERILAAQTQLNFGVTEYLTGEEKYFGATSTQLTDVVHGIHASIAIPALYRDPVLINGVRYNDGGPSCRLLRKALSYKPTGIVVLMNGPGSEHEPLSKKVLVRTLMRGEPEVQQKVMRRRYETASEDMQELQGSGVPHLVVYSDDKVGSYTRDPQILKAAAERSCEHFLSLLSSAGI